MEDVVRNPHGVKLEPVDFNSGFPGSEKYDLIVCDYNHALVEGMLIALARSMISLVSLPYS